MYIKFVWGTKDDDPGRMEVVETEKMRIEWGHGEVKTTDGATVKGEGYLMAVTTGETLTVLGEGDAAYIMNEAGKTIDRFNV